MKKTGEYRKIAALALAATLTLGTLSAGCSGGSSGGSSSGGGETSATAVEMRLQRAVGNVKLTNEKGEERTLMEKMRLASGDAIVTEKESMADVSLDETKLVTIEEKSKVQIIGDSRNLEIHCVEGNLFINVTEKVAEGASLDIHVGNIVCGSRATSGYHGVDENGNEEVMTGDGIFEVGFYNANGEWVTVQAGPGEKVVLVKAQGSGTEQILQLVKTKYTEEQMPSIALVSIKNNGDLMERVTGSTDFSKEKIVALADVMSRVVVTQTGEEQSVPIMGHEGSLLNKAAVEALKASDGDLALQIAIINGVKTVLEQEREKGTSDEDMTRAADQATDTIKKAVEDMKSRGLTGEDMIKGVQELNLTTQPATPENQQPQVPSNVTGEQPAPETVTDTITGNDNDSGSSSGRKREVTPPTPETPPAQPAPPAPGPDQGEKQEQQQEQQQQEQQAPPQTLGDAELVSDGVYSVSLSNDAQGQLIIGNDSSGPRFNVTSFVEDPIVLPIGITMPDGQVTYINSVTSIFRQNSDLGYIAIEGAPDSASTIETHFGNNWAGAQFEVSNAYTRISGSDGSMYITTQKGTIAALMDFMGTWQRTDISGAQYGEEPATSIRVDVNGDLRIIVGSNCQFVYKGTVSSTSDYVEVEGEVETMGSAPTRKRFRIHTDATITEVE